ncbi:MAG: hypothetical protein D3923_06510 [Candidatus Electrothrix sp. AR3]|nr:hypothetical protein [Candidatus Electrothrix sp. AR3]
MMGDHLMTGLDGSMGVLFTDNSRISLGPVSKITIDQYIYNPQQGIFSFLLSTLQGTASYISGAIGRLFPNGVEIQTPRAVVGIRGTFFLVRAEPAIQRYQHLAQDLFVLMPEDNHVGAIHVTNNFGRIRLSKARQPEHPVILSEQAIQNIFQAALQAIPDLEPKHPPNIFFPFMKDFPNVLKEATLQAAPECAKKKNPLIPFVLMKDFPDILRKAISAGKRQQIIPNSSSSSTVSVRSHHPVSIISTKKETR